MSLRDRITIEAARVAAAAFCGQGDRRALLIVTYHRVLETPDPLLPGEPSAAEFAAQLDALQRTFNLLPLPEAHARLQAGTLPPRAACLTFDDGYANNCEIALPLLEQRGVPATVFIATGFLDGGRMFNDTVIEAVRRAPRLLDLEPLGLKRYEFPDDSARLRAIDEILPAIKHLDPAERARRAEFIAEIAGADMPRNLMMTSAQVRTLAERGVDVGGHTVTHPILTRVPLDEARHEIEEGKRRLEEITGQRLKSFAYPNGRPNDDYTAEHAQLVQQAGFEVGVSTARAVAVRGCDPFQVPRTPIWGRTVADKVLRLAAAYLDRDYTRAITAPGGAPATTAPASPAPR